ncbi:IgGFc-binding protein-like [Epinephelus lanceolatus]|uniref:IgGFc-binding protein-like n=1 Tax=Epinephelus lanceolatus TaxID=310571 RepID=UPI001446B9B0|nr:IgGFc-binding protein-like [Epinephelus lanceolatus]
MRLVSGDPAIMRPALLVLLLAAANTESTVTPPEDNTGLKFIIAFPENIAYYYPILPENKVQITAMHDQTKVTITAHPDHSTVMTLGAGATLDIPIDNRKEMWRSETVYDRSVQITSTKNITVLAISQKSNSMQTALVIPTDRLGTKYLIPLVPVIQGTTAPANIVTTDVTERGPFRLIIINADEENTVTVEGADTQVVSLQPHQISQMWLKENRTLRTVTATQPVAVLFGHACAIRHNCTCGQLYTSLQPATEKKLKFYIPPVLAKDAEDEPLVLLTEKDSSKVKAFNPDSPLVEAAGTAIFYRPGLLLTLIPETDFAACYVISSIPDTESFAVIVVHKDFIDGVHVNSALLEDADWQELKGTDYVSALTGVASGKSVIWHSSSKMAVYFVGNKEGTLFGNPAPIISTSPDFRGCILSPGVLKIGEVANGWRESLKYCRDNGLELVSFPEAQLQRQLYEKILQAKNSSMQVVWIGLRRSSQSGEWYWLNKAAVSDTNWGEGEPGTVHDGQCAIMSLEKGHDFGWSDEDCCKAAHPVCYKEPVLFPIDGSTI